MEVRNGEVHVDAPEARAGSTNNTVRYVLLISIVLAILAMTIIWVTGALNSDQGNNAQANSQRAVAEEQATKP